MKNEPRFDAIVIGGSFAGLSGAMQIARTGRSVCVLDTGAPRNRFAARSHGFFGQDGMPPFEMIAMARQKLAAYPAVTFVDEAATGAKALGDGFAVTLASGAVLRSEKLLLAFGVSDGFPDIPGIADHWGQTVLHCPYCHGYEFRGKALGVLARSPLALHQALMISDWGPVTLFLNGIDMPDAASRAKLDARGVTLDTTLVTRIEGTAPILEGVRLADGRLVPVEALYLMPKTSMGSPIAGQLGCAMEDGPFGPVVKTDPATKMTSVVGVYAAGDITRAAHNATFASADGVLAGASLHQSLIFEPLAAAFG